MSNKKNSDASFLVQGSILAMASIISRIVGLLYRMPLKAIIGKVGNDYYSTAYSVYNIILIISCYSIPLAVSKLVSERMGKGRVKDAYRVFKVALTFAIISGGIGALVMYFGAEFFTGTLLKTPLSVYALKILAPTLFVVSILGVFRGFFQGLNTMIPSAISQVAEQILNAVVSIYAAYMLVQYGRKVGEAYNDIENYGSAYGAAGGTIGTASGAVLALIFMLVVFMCYKGSFEKKLKRDFHRSEESYSSIAYVFILTILPVLLSTTVSSLGTLIDQGVFKNIANVQGYTAKEISEWWGVYAGQFSVLTNVPVAIASALAASTMPSISRAFHGGDKEVVNHQIELATRFIMIICIPAAIGMSVLGGPINQLLFADDDVTTAFIMLFGCFSVIFYGLSTLTNGLLQGIDHMSIPVINAVISLVIHAIVLVSLMYFFDLNIYAVVIANNVYSLGVCILNDLAIKRHSSARTSALKTYILPFVSALVMGAVVFGAYKLIYFACQSVLVGVCVAIGLGVIVYFVVLIMIGGLDADELQQMPKGHLLVRLGRKVHLFR